MLSDDTTAIAWMSPAAKPSSLTGRTASIQRALSKSSPRPLSSGREPDYAHRNRSAVVVVVRACFERGSQQPPASSRVCLAPVDAVFQTQIAIFQ